jgi:hypothetical protein
MRQFILLFLWLAVCCSCQNDSHKTEAISVKDSVSDSLPARQIPTEKLSQRDSLQAIGRQVLLLIKSQNYPELVKYFANEGVLFSPYSYIDPAKSKKLDPEDFLTSINKKWLLTWGNFDGTGDPIKLTVVDYLKEFVYNADYLNAEAIGYDKVMQEGNSHNNIQEIYPKHHFIDYYFSGFDQKNKGMDWTSLRLVFQRENNDYTLVAVIHDQWTT